MTRKFTGMPTEATGIVYGTTIVGQAFATTPFLIMTALNRMTAPAPTEGD